MLVLRSSPSPCLTLGRDTENVSTYIVNRRMEAPITDGKAKCWQGLARRGLHRLLPRPQYHLLPGVLPREKSEPIRLERCSSMRNKSGKVLCSGQCELQITGSLGKLGIGTGHSKSMKPSNLSSNNIIRRESGQPVLCG